MNNIIPVLYSLGINPFVCTTQVHTTKKCLCIRKWDTIKGELYHMILSKAKKSIDFNVQLLLCLEKFVRKSENLCGIFFLIKNISMD